MVRKQDTLSQDSSPATRHRIQQPPSLSGMLCSSGNQDLPRQTGNGPRCSGSSRLFPSATFHIRWLHGFGVMPDISCIMCNDPLNSINLPSCASGIGSQGIYKVNKRQFEFTKVCNFGWPVIHLNIDIYVIVGAPWWLQSIGPDPLQVGRKVSGTGAADKQIPAKLIIRVQSDPYQYNHSAWQ